MSEFTTDRVVFEASSRMRQTRRLRAFLVFALCIPPLFILGPVLARALATGAWGQGLGVVWHGGLIALLPVLLLAFIVVRYRRQQLHFRVELTPEHIVVGHGRLAQKLSYEEVDLVSLPTRREAHGSSWMDLVAQGRQTRVDLGTRSAECARLLAEMCPNAVFCDELGQEHLPTRTDRPLGALRTLAWKQRRRAWLYVRAGLVTSAPLAFLFMGSWMGAQNLASMHLWLVAFGAPPLFYLTWREFRKMQATQREIAELTRQNMTAR